LVERLIGGDGRQAFELASSRTSRPSTTSGLPRAARERWSRSGRGALGDQGRSRCTGTGLCAELLPEWIVLDDWGYPMIDQRPLAPELREHAHNPCGHARPWRCARCRRTGP